MARASRVELRFGDGLTLGLALGDEPPPDSQMLVVPQDVNLIMDELAPIEDGGQPVEEVVAETAGFRPRRLGSILLRAAQAGRPLLVQAVVYDFERSPPVRDDHVFEALLAAFEETQRRGFDVLAVRPLGTAHGGLEQAGFLGILTQICYSSVELGTSLRRVHLLLASSAELAAYEALLLRARGELRRRRDR